MMELIWGKMNERSMSLKGQAFLPICVPAGISLKMPQLTIKVPNLQTWWQCCIDKVKHTKNLHSYKAISQGQKSTYHIPGNVVK